MALSSRRGRLALAALLAGVAATPRPGAAASPEDGLPAAPVAKEHRYRLSAAIRPLLFWVGAKNVGGARIVWRDDGDGRRGYELLLGSDPARAPRRINRWGWAREDADASGATMVGVMNRSEDDTLEQAKTSLGRGQNGYSCKMIRARVENGGARAESTTVVAPRDYTFRQLGELRQYVANARPAPRVRTSPLPEGVRPGLLFALAELVDGGLAAARRAEGSGPGPRSVPYTFNGGLYDLAVTSWQRVPQARYGGKTFDRLVRLEFESHNREKGTTERFVLACGTEGSLAGVPVFVRYQPKWWFKVEGVLDESESL